MSLLDDGVLSSVSPRGLGMFRFAYISRDHRDLLKSITPRQRGKFKNKELEMVPCQLLQVIWDLGFLPGKERPQEGMRIPNLRKFLQEGRYTDRQNRERGEWLYEQINSDRLRAAERNPHRSLAAEIDCERYIKYGRGKWISVSQIREMPGTIIR